MSRISKVVIPAAGLGTRLLSATKEQPKEMLPIFSVGKAGELLVKPIVQVIFEQLYDAGFREFYFIVGRSKRALEDHFTPDYEFVNNLEKKGKSSYANHLYDFYQKLSTSTIVWINQPMPLGFGHAVLLVKNLIGDEHFLVHAGDTIIFSEDNKHLTELSRHHSGSRDYCTLLVNEVENPTQFGVVDGEPRANGTMKITHIEEKPVNPRTNNAIMPVYVFDPIIFKALENIEAGKGGELQLTDGIKKIVDWGLHATASKLSSSDLWIDVGTPETYWQAQSATYKKFSALALAATKKPGR